MTVILWHKTAHTEMASARDEQLVVTVARTTILVINTLQDSMENIFQTLYVTYLHSEAVYTTLVKVRLQFTITHLGKLSI